MNYVPEAARTLPLLVHTINSGPSYTLSKRVLNKNSPYRLTLNEVGLGVAITVFLGLLMAALCEFVLDKTGMGSLGLYVLLCFKLAGVCVMSGYLLLSAPEVRAQIQRYPYAIRFVDNYPEVKVFVNKLNELVQIRYSGSMSWGDYRERVDLLTSLYDDHIASIKAENKALYVNELSREIMASQPLRGITAADVLIRSDIQDTIAKP